MEETFFTKSWINIEKRELVEKRRWSNRKEMDKKRRSTNLDRDGDEKR